MYVVEHVFVLKYRILIALIIHMGNVYGSKDDYSTFTNNGCLRSLLRRNGPNKMAKRSVYWLLPFLNSLGVTPQKRLNVLLK